MEYLLDTADPQEVSSLLVCYPIAGVTTNPSIIKQCGRVDLFPRFSELRRVLGGSRSLHIQVTAPDAEGMLREALAVRSRIDSKVYIKVPVNEEGLRAIRLMKDQSFPVTATGIVSKAQALLALECGADYLALYYNRMENSDISPDQSIEMIASVISRFGYASKILGASFRNMAQVDRAIASGAHAVTLSPSILRDALRLPAISSAVEAFAADWRSLYGDRSIDRLD